jgi:hypothetical protein
VVTGDKKFLLPVRSSENRGLRIVGAVGEKLQSQKWMGGSAFSQINLNGVCVPFSIRAHHHKIQSKASDDSFFGETLANLRRFSRDQPSIAGVGREDASQVTLP